MHYLQVFWSFCLCVPSCVHIKSVQRGWVGGGRSLAGGSPGKPGCVLSLQQPPLQVGARAVPLRRAKGTVLLVAVGLDEVFGVHFW